MQIWYAKDGQNTVGTSSIYTVGKFDGLVLVIDPYAGSVGPRWLCAYPQRANIENRAASSEVSLTTAVSNTNHTIASTASHLGTAITPTETSDDPQESLSANHKKISGWMWMAGYVSTPRR